MCYFHRWARLWSFNSGIDCSFLHWKASLMSETTFISRLTFSMKGSSRGKIIKNFLFFMPVFISSGGQVESSTAGSVLHVMGTLWNTTWRITSLLTVSMISFNTTRRPTCDVLNLSCVWRMLCQIPVLMRLKSMYSRRQAPGLLYQRAI